MIDEATIDQLVAQYEKYGWRLRRILLTPMIAASLSKPSVAKYENATVISADIDALWFSRINKDLETWEIRRVGGAPFALVRFVQFNASDSEREGILLSAQTEIASTTSKPVDHQG